MKPFRRLVIPVIGMLGLAWSGAWAASLQESVSQAVLTHPEVQASWHELQASGHETDVVRGARLPKVDVLVSAHRERRDRAPANGERDYATSVSKLSLQQNVFDGFATRSNIQRLDHSGRALYYEMLATSETVAFAATQAYINLYRQQQQLEYAKENYVTHRGIFERLRMRTSAGLAPLVDLEMAGARLALAESELQERAGQFHDAKARYQHVVGTLPDAETIAPPPSLLTQAMPKSRADAVALGISTSPRLKAAIERILSAQRKVAVQRSPMYPRVDFLADTSRERNPDGVTGTERRTTLGFQLNYNLFHGNKDSSRLREAAEAKYRAADDRDTTCRQLREDLAKTFNDNTRFTEQLPLLDQHQLSADKSREAMLQQFGVGRRTLLDLLDTESEYYKARSDYLAGEMDLAVAQTRYLANAGLLLGTLQLAHREAGMPPAHTELDEDVTTQCPPDIVPELPPPPQPKKTESYAVLLADADGNVGQITVKGAGGEQTIDKPLFGVPMDGSAAPARVDDERIKRDFGEAMAARPALPESYLLYFRSNSARLTDKSREMLPGIVASINSRPSVEITLTGHADTVGSVKVNKALSLKRAKAIADYLKSRKVDTSKLEIEAHGKSVLLVPTPDQTAEQGNRAVMIRVR